MVAGLEHSKRSYIMSQIGSFTRSNDGVYTGAIKTLAIDAKARLVPSDPASTSDKAPDLRVLVSGVEIGAAWRRHLEGGPRLPLGQARRSQLHRPHLRQPLRGRERRTCADLVALIGARDAPPHDGASRTSPRYYAERYRRQSPGKPFFTAPELRIITRYA